jgi:hypothetical protein
MPTNDSRPPEIDRLFKADEQRRQRLAALPFPEKVRLVIQMQRIVEPILRARGRLIHIWQID